MKKHEFFGKVVPYIAGIIEQGTYEDNFQQIVDAVKSKYNIHTSIRELNNYCQQIKLREYSPERMGSVKESSVPCKDLDNLVRWMTGHIRSRQHNEAYEGEVRPDRDSIIAFKFKPSL